MRTLTAREQALYAERLAAVRQWANRMEGAPNTLRLFSRARVDAMAATTRTRQDLVYRAVLVEPVGNVAHHLLTPTVWGYIRDEMRIAPTVFYARATSQWATIYAGGLPADYRRATVAANGAIEPTLVRDTEIPGGYRNVSDSKVMEFLNASGGRIIPLDEIPDPYPPLSFDDFTVTVPDGEAAFIHKFAPVGGKPPLVYTAVTPPTTVVARVAGNRFIVARGTTPVGTYAGGTVKVTDSLGASATATVTVVLQ